MKSLKPIFWIIFIAVLIFGGALITLYTDWLWFLSLNYEKVFTKMLISKIELGTASGLIFFLVIYINLWLARKKCPAPNNSFEDMPVFGKLAAILKQGIGLVIFLVSIIISVVVALQATTHWSEYLFFLNPTSFNETDPIFQKDIGFYVFSFPFLKYIYNWFFGSLMFSTLLTAGFYYSLSAISFIDGQFKMKIKARNHLFVLIGLMFLLKSVGFILDMYDLLFIWAEKLTFTGASYAAVKAGIPCLWVMVTIAIIAALITFVNTRSNNWKGVIWAIAIVFVGNILFTIIIPKATQVILVKPNQLEKEKPYIRHAIKATRDAYGLNNIISKEFAADNTLTPQQVSDNQGTIENIRLWDSGQLLKSYSQIQTIQQYYSFKDVDVDRYWLKDKVTGEEKYRQVWLSARELNQAELPDDSKTWVNTRLQYTHGYGYAMSPVNEISSEGMPRFFIYDIPPKTSIEMPINKMGIYMGEKTDNEIFVNTTAKEFDYPKGTEVVNNKYDGKDGVKIGNFFKKLLFAIRFGNINILLNTNINNKSQVLFHRNVSDRIKTLFPFMVFENDPYLITSDGNLYWMLDGFTTSEYYPYAQKVKIDDASGHINYIRNSFKILVNAYTGEVNAYTINKPLNDPIMKSYQKIYKGVFKDFSEMPKDLACHIRYPQAVFNIQADIFKKYHMTEPAMFYSGSDLWGIPAKSVLGELDEEGSENLQEPYYTIMKFPEGKKEEFILMTTFTRAGKKNMCAWIAAQCDGDNYGKILLYNFPKDKNVYGPQQITARINQDDIISPQITLWSLQGSKVNAGNLLVIPIENSILYVMPLYLESTSTKIPELKRIIVALGDRIAMEETLEGALSKLVTEKKIVKSEKDLINEACSEFEKAKDSQQAGNWAKYGEHISILESILKQLQK